MPQYLPQVFRIHIIAFPSHRPHPLHLLLRVLAEEVFRVEAAVEEAAEAGELEK